MAQLTQKKVIQFQTELLAHPNEEMESMTSVAKNLDCSAVDKIEIRVETVPSRSIFKKKNWDFCTETIFFFQDSSFEKNQSRTCDLIYIN